MTEFKGLMAAIETVRLTVRGLQTEMQSLLDQRRSRSEVAQFVEGSVQRWELQGMTAIETDLARCARGEPVEFLLARAVAYTPQAMIRIEVQMGPVLTALFGADVVQAALLDRLDTVPVGLEPETRLQRIGELRDRLDELGYEEEGLIRESWANGELVDPRPDADPRHALTYKASE